MAKVYVTDRHSATEDVLLLEHLERRLQPGSRVLDLGCGAGDPVTKRLARNYRVTGIDISEKQIALAAERVPSAEFRCENIVDANLGEEEYDAVCSYYAIIHIPREHHRPILGKVYSAIRPGGFALLCLGANDISDDRDDFYGAPMYWSHYDAETYRAMLPELGFEILMDRLVVDESCPTASHLFVLVQKRGE